jgi:hypothetical protein
MMKMIIQKHKSASVFYAISTIPSPLSVHRKKQKTPAPPNYMVTLIKEEKYS